MRLWALLDFAAKLQCLLYEARIGSTVINLKIGRDVGTIDSLRERLQRFRREGLAEKTENGP